MPYNLSYWWLLVLLLVPLLVLHRLILRFFGVIIIPEDCVGIVNKKFVLFGSNRTMPDGAIIALKGEAGFQADTLAPGIHFLLWPWKYAVLRQKFITIPEDSIGVVEARDGKPLSGGRVLARHVDCDAFQNARHFLTNGGERGPQISIIPPGTYRINTALFSVQSAPVFEVPQKTVGIITVKEGKALMTGEIAGMIVPGHNAFQDGQAFVDAGGYKGLQEQVLLSGRYFINPSFATVEAVEMTEVPIAHVGVVIAFVGREGRDLTGDAFKHGNLVSKGDKGVWLEPLDPGKYPINPRTHRVELVPTANVVLNWATGKTESHKLDANLATITVRSSDGFKFNLDVSQIIHIPRTDAPKVIARFGNMLSLVTQVLEPTIGNYFRNAAQGSDVIDFLKQRAQRQAEAKASIAAALDDFNVGAVDTLIGDIVPPDELMKTLTDRKLAEQEKITFQTQREAEQNRMEFEQAKALANTQARVVDSERSVKIAEYAAQAAIKTAEGSAQSKKINAEADGNVLTIVGAAEAGKVEAVGSAEAAVIKLKINSMESGNYAGIEIAKALGASGVRLVPDIMVSGGANGHGGSLVDVLLGNLIRDQLANTPATPKNRALAPPASAPMTTAPEKKP